MGKFKKNFIILAIILTGVFITYNSFAQQTPVNNTSRGMSIQDVLQQLGLSRGSDGRIYNSAGVPFFENDSELEQFLSTHGYQQDSSGNWHENSNYNPNNTNQANNNNQNSNYPIVYAQNGSSNANNTNATTNCGEEGLAGQRFLFFRGPLVPCGVNKHCAGNNNLSIDKPCTLCHFFVLIQNFFNFLLSLLIVVSIFMLTIAGVLYIVSAGGKMATIAKEIIQKTLLGFTLFLLSWLIIFTLLKLLAVNTSMLGTGGDTGWFQFTCDDESAFWVPTENQHTPNPPNQHTPNPPNQHTPNPPPTQQTEEEARREIQQATNNQVTFWHSPTGTTNIKDLRPATKQEIIQFQREVNRPIAITAGAETGNGHNEDGEYTHAHGYKFDVDTNDTDNDPLVRYVRSHYDHIGTRADGAQLFQNSRGVYYAIEGNHLDVCVRCPRPRLSNGPFSS